MKSFSSKLFILMDLVLRQLNNRKEISYYPADISFGCIHPHQTMYALCEIERAGIIELVPEKSKPINFFTKNYSTYGSLISYDYDLKVISKVQEDYRDYEVKIVVRIKSLNKLYKYLKSIYKECLDYDKQFARRQEPSGIYYSYGLEKEVPEYRSDSETNFYSMKDQLQLVRSKVKEKYLEFKSVFLYIDQSLEPNESVHFLMCIFMLYAMGDISIVELKNNRKKWSEPDNIKLYIKILEPDSFSVKSKKKIIYRKKVSLPKDSFWKGDSFFLGDTKITFDGIKIKKYFSILLQNIGKPVYNENCYKQLSYEKPRDVANMAKKDLANKLNGIGVLRTEERKNGRIEIKAVRNFGGIKKQNAGYVCTIYPK